MKRGFILIFSILLALASPLSLRAEDAMEQHQRDTENLYRPGACAEDSSFTAISASMIGWGLGLAAGIALLTGLLHQSKASHAHSD